MTIKNLLTGYAAVLFASPKHEERNPDGRDLIASNGKGENAVEVRRMSDVLVQFPATAEALNAACAACEIVIETEDGQTVKFTGVNAAAAMEYKHALEVIRSMLRATKKDGSFKYTDEQIRSYAESFTKITGRESLGVAKVEVDENDFNTPEGIARIKAALAAAGALKKSEAVNA